MSLSNLQAIGRLQAQPPDPPAMARLLQAARQNLSILEKIATRTCSRLADGRFDP